MSTLKPPKPSLSSQEAGVAIDFFWLVLRKHWPILLGSLLLSVGISLVYSKSQQRIYQADALLEIDPTPPGPLGDKGEGFALSMGTNYFDNREYLETQYRIVTSTPVLKAAARDVRLNEDYGYFGLKAPPTEPITLDQAAAALQTRVSVEAVRNSRLAHVRVEDTSPERAKRLTQAVVEAFRDQNLQRAINASSDAFVWLSSQVEDLKKELETNENSLHEFKAKNDLPSISINEASNMIRQEMQDFNSDLSRTRARHQELEARNTQLAKVLDDDPENLPASEFLNNQFLQKLRTEYLESKRLKETLLKQGFGENHNQVKAVTGKIEETRSALLTEVRNIRGAVQRDVAAIRDEESRKAGLYDDAHRRAVDLNMKEIEYHRLDRSRDQNEKLYAMLLEHMKQTDLSRMMRLNNIRVVESAVTPVAPIRPKTGANLLTGLFIGLIAGFALMWLREAADNRLKSPDDVEAELGVTFLGFLPSSEELQPGAPKKAGRLRRRAAPVDPGRAELIVHDRPTSALAEAARSIRTNLTFANPDHPFKKLLVTSAAPSEGKTTVACSIAIALAQSGQRVCIIDCDLRKPRLHRIFDRVGHAGLTNVLLGDATIEEVAAPTQVPNLDVVPSGPIPPNAADVVQSERFRKLIDELASRYDRIVIDSPPLVAVTDAAIISTIVDGTVYVLRAFSTTRGLARQGLRALTDVDAPVAGTVLNAVDLGRGEYGYKQYYYYRRGGYGEDATTEPKSATWSNDGEVQNAPSTRQ